MNKRKKIKVSIKKNQNSEHSSEDYIKYLQNLAIGLLRTESYNSCYPRYYLQSTGEEYNGAVYIHGHGEPYTDGHGNKVIER